MGDYDDIAMTSVGRGSKLEEKSGVPFVPKVAGGRLGGILYLLE